MKRAKDFLIECYVTSFGLGHAPVASGTFGTLGGVALAAMVGWTWPEHYLPLILGLMVVVSLGGVACDQAQRFALAQRLPDGRAGLRQHGGGAGNPVGIPCDHRDAGPCRHDPDPRQQPRPGLEPALIGPQQQHRTRVAAFHQFGDHGQRHARHRRKDMPFLRGVRPQEPRFPA